MVQVFPSKRCSSQLSLSVVSQSTATAAHSDLLRQQEELERKAAELDRREQEIQNRTAASTNPGGESLQSLQASSVCLEPVNINTQTIHSLLESDFQPKRTTGHLFQRFYPSSPASTRTLKKRSQKTTAESAKECTTFGCVRKSVCLCRRVSLHQNSLFFNNNYFLNLFLSPQLHSVPQCVGMPGLLHCRPQERGRLRSLHPLVHPLHPSGLRLLVPTRLQSLQVSRPSSALISLTCFTNRTGRDRFYTTSLKLPVGRGYLSLGGKSENHQKMVSQNPTETFHLNIQPEDAAGKLKNDK